MMNGNKLSLNKYAELYVCIHADSHKWDLWSSIQYYSKEEVKLWYGKKGQSHNCYAEEHKWGTVCFFSRSVSNPVAYGLTA